MPKRILFACLSTFVSLTFATASFANTIAITEFMNNPDGEDDGREWVELYNYGAAPVDLDGYTLADEDSDSYTFGAVNIGAGDFVILVNSGGVPDDAAAKAVFEAEWLGGTADSRVIGGDFGALSNSGDELFLSDAGTSVVWSLAYDNDEDEDSTALVDADFSVTAYGDKDAPGIDRAGIDTVGLIGYEDSGDLATTFLNDADAVKDAAFLTSLGIATDFYDGVDPDTSEADPFVLSMSVPEPSSIGLALVGLLMLGIRRRK